MRGFVVVVVLLGCVGATVAPDECVEVVGVGASLPAMLLRSVAIGFQATTNQNTNLDYTPLGSRHGQCRIVGNFSDPECDALRHVPPTDVDFAATELGFSDREYNATADLQVYPMVAAGVVPVYNIASLRRPSHPNLALHPATLARIFSGNVTHWRDPTIVNDQAVKDRGLQDLLPDAGIVVCARADASGTTAIMTSALESFDAGFVPVGAVVPGNFVLRFGAEGVSACVSQTPNSISYQVYSIAKSLEVNNLARLVDLAKHAGTIVASRTTIESALYEFSWGFGNTERLTASLINAQGVSSWPIVGFSYVAMRKDYIFPSRTCAQKAAALDFFTYFLSDPLSHQLIGDRGFAVLPSSIRGLVLARMNQDLTCDGTPIYTAPVRTILTMYGPESLRAPFEVFAAHTAVTLGSQMEYETGEVPYPTVLARVRDYSQTVAAGAVLPRSVTNAVAIGEDLTLLPFVAVPYAIVTGLCDNTIVAESCVFERLLLDAEAVTVLFGGGLVRWDNPVLTRLNPLLEGVGDDVQPFLRDDPTDLELVGEFGRRFDPTFEPVPTTNETQSAVLARAFAMNNSVTITPLSTAFQLRGAGSVATLVFEGAELQSDEASIARCLQHTLDIPASTDRLCYPLAMVFSVVVRSEYSGCAEVFAGKHLTEAVQWMFGYNMTKAFVGDVYDTIVPTAQLQQWLATNSRAISAITCDGECIACSSADHHLISSSTRTAFFTLASLFLVACASLVVWISRNTSCAVVAQAQPLFLKLCVLGCMIQATTVFFRADGGEYDDLTGRLTDHHRADAFCRVSYWTYSLGFTIIYCALLAKTWRVWRIFVGSRGMQRRFRITLKDTAPLVLLGVGAQATTLAVWQLLDAPRLEVNEREVDALGHVVDSDWSCSSDSNAFVVLLLLSLDVVALVFSNWLCFLCREIPTQHAEGKWISLTLFSMLQTFVVAAPILLLMDLTPQSRFVLEASVVLGQVGQVLGFVLLPKVLAAHFKRTREHSVATRKHSFDSYRTSLLFQRPPNELDALPRK